MTDLVVKLVITADGKQSVQELKLTEKELAELKAKNTEAANASNEHERATAKLGGALKVMGVAAAAAVAALGVATVREAAKAYAEAEQSNARLAAVLRATGHAAGLSTREVNGLVDSLTASSQFDDESLRNAAAVMATFRNVQGETYKEGIALAADLSALLGTDLQSSVMQVGKALNDPLEGITALSRAGITFSEVQKDQIKHFVETNELGKAQRLVLDELQKQFGGTAEAMNQGLAGATSTLHKAWNDLYEDIGARIAPLLTEITQAAINATNALRDVVRGDITQNAGDPAGWLNEQILKMRAELDAAEQELTDEANSLFGLSDKEEQEINARIERIKARIIQASIDANRYAEKQQALGIKTPEQEAREGAARVRAKAQADALAAELKAASEKARKRTDLGIDTDDVFAGFREDDGPQPNVIELTKRRAEIQAAAEHAAFQAGARQRLQSLDESLQTETERIDDEYRQRADDAALAYSAQIIDLQGYKERETQAWAAAEAKKTAIAQSEANKRKAQDDQEFRWKVQTAHNVASILGSLASLSEGRSKEEFKRAQRLARAQTIVNTAAMAIAAGRDTPGPWWVRAAAVAAAIATGAAQLNKINETKYDGGGSIASATGGGAGGAVPGTSSAGTTGTGAIGGAPQGSAGTTYIAVVGNDNAQFTGAQVRTLIQAIREEVVKGNQIILAPDSVNAQLIINAVNAQAA